MHDIYVGYHILLLLGSSQRKTIEVEDLKLFLIGSQKTQGLSGNMFGVCKRVSNKVIDDVLIRLFKKGFIAMKKVNGQLVAIIEFSGMKLITELEQKHFVDEQYKRYLNRFIKEKDIVRRKLKPSVRVRPHTTYAPKDRSTRQPHYLDQNTRFSKAPVKSKPGRLRTINEMKHLFKKQ